MNALGIVRAAKPFQSDRKGAAEWSDSGTLKSPTRRERPVMGEIDD